MLSNLMIELEINEALKNMDSWIKPRSVGTPLMHFPAKSSLLPEPLGVALIIGSWNYPFAVTIMPLATAIAAGDAAVIKPSEMAPATSRAMTKLVTKYLDSRFYRSIEG